MADNNNLFGNSKDKVIETKDFSIRGHLLRWYDTAIQISNISMVSTADLPLPRFPAWTVVGIIIGLALMAQESYYDEFSTIQAVGLGILIGAIVWIIMWYMSLSKLKDKKYLHLFLNSGNVYSFVFSGQKFLGQVLQLLANIIETGTTSSTNFNINVQGCEIRENGSVVHVFER